MVALPRGTWPLLVAALVLLASGVFFVIVVLRQDAGADCMARGGEPRNGPWLHVECDFTSLPPLTAPPIAATFDP